MWIYKYKHISKNRGGEQYIYTDPLYFFRGKNIYCPPYICSGGSPTLFRRPYSLVYNKWVSSLQFIIYHVLHYSTTFYYYPTTAFL